MNDYESVSPAKPVLGPAIRKILKPIASLQLTVVLFALSLVLVFFGTLVQKKAGIWTVVDQYFWSWIVMIDTQLFVDFCAIFFDIDPKTRFSVRVPFPGGKLIGGVMFVNLLAAHALRFSLTWRRSGIFILHGGLLLMFAGEFITRVYSVEQRMRIHDGESADYTMDSREYELAIVEQGAGKTERTVAVPARRLTQGGRIELADLPFDLNLIEYYANTELRDYDFRGDAPRAATNGIGYFFSVKGIEPISGVETDDSKIDVPGARIEFVLKDGGKSLGTWFTSLMDGGQNLKTSDKTYRFELRYTRHYKPYTIKLHKVHADLYPGTEIPKNYSSDIQLIDPEQGLDQAVTIRMNEPMRHRGETFYQSGVQDNITTTVLSVVENPGWLLPYISCAVVTFGMLLHFGIHLSEYLRRLLRKKGEPDSKPMQAGEVIDEVRTLIKPWRLFRRILSVSAVMNVKPTTKFQRWLPLGILALMVILVAGASMQHGKPGKGGIDLTRVGRLPVLSGGRIKPLDTVARVDLRVLNHKETYVNPDERKNRSAIEWWMSTAARVPSSYQAEVFRIESDQLLNLFGLTRREGLRYSYEEISRKGDKFLPAYRAAKSKSRDQRNLLDNKVLDFSDKLGAFERTGRGDAMLAIPPDGDIDWRSLKDGQDLADRRLRMRLTNLGFNVPSEGSLDRYEDSLKGQERQRFAAVREKVRMTVIEQDPRYQSWEKLFAAYRAGNQEQFDKATAELEGYAEAGISEKDRNRVRLESFLNDYALYYWCIPLYVFAALFTVVAWIQFSFNAGMGHAWRRGALYTLVLAFTLQGITLLARMYLMDRWWVFVTNLYSTAVFIGWAAVGVSLVIERVFPITLGCIIGSVIGFLTSILAHNIAASGDTLEMMRAVLDTNFWLATHVTTINLGYAATYVAGLIGIMYLCIGIYTPYLTRPIDVNGQKMELGRLIGQILYGAVAAATVLSFVGTVLGGIWGDQSWGRFWGWDPKENGALMIVIWNALILHARWAGLVKDRGIAILALGGNMITTWSYFGTNQLGVGLHAYGFSKTLAEVCMYMWILNLMLVSNGLIPKQFWRSYQQDNLPSGKAVLNRGKK